MGWMALSVAFLGTTYLAVHYRGFRRGLLYTLCGLVVLALIGGMVAWYSDYQDGRRRQAASLLIKPSQIEISQAKLSIGTLPELTGVVANRSEHDLYELFIKVTVTDCPNNIFADLIPPAPSGFERVPTSKSLEHGENPFQHFKNAQDDTACSIVGEDVAHLYSLKVPKGQKRAFRDFVSFPNLPTMKEWSWHYSIEKIIAGD